MTKNAPTIQPLTILNQPLRPIHYWIVTVASMEQIIGAALSTAIGIMIPMMQMLLHPQMSPILQGIVGAMGLIGIGVGSMLIGKMSDKFGYLNLFRLCPVIIMAGSLICFLGADVPWVIVGLFVAGVGVGGGYSLDSSYISELMPTRWSDIMVGIAKGSCAIGFIATAAISMLVIKLFPTPEVWPYLIFIVGGMGLVTLLMRIRWAGSPRWLALHGRIAQAQAAARRFFGPNIGLGDDASPDAPVTKAVSWGDMLRGSNLLKVIYSGIPWACEGLGVYGFGVFLPVMVMALGIDGGHSTGMAKVIMSVEMTTVVNFFILPGFIIGLCVMRRLNHVRMLAGGFVVCAVGLALLLVAYLWHLPVWVTILGFVLFEVFLNAGPHLITYVIPSSIYSVAERGAGSGIAAMLGKVGAVVGVILMPILLDIGGMTLVLIVSIAVMLAGALIALIFGHILGLTKQ